MSKAEDKYKVSVITVCYNGYADTCRLIDSLLSVIHSVELEIIVVDNGSKRNEATMLRNKYASSVKVLRSETNTGFAGANNIGLNICTGTYICMLNNDTFVAEDGLLKLIQHLESDLTAGAASPKIRFAEPPHLIQYAGYTPLSRITIRNRTIGYGELDGGKYDRHQPTAYLHGAAMIIKREVLNRVGVMPEAYFLYYEEIEWSLQIIRAGYTIWYYPAWTVYHVGAHSVGTQTFAGVFYHTRSRLLFAQRNRKAPIRWMALAYLLTIPVWRSIINYSRHKQFSLIAALFKGICAFCNLFFQNKGIKVNNH